LYQGRVDDSPHHGEDCPHDYLLPPFHDASRSKCPRSTARSVSLAFSNALCSSGGRACATASKLTWRKNCSKASPSLWGSSTSIFICGALSRGIFPVSSRKPSHRADCESKRRRRSHSCARSQATSEHTQTLAERLFAT